MEALCTQVAQWRAQSGGGRGHRIPRALWEQAIAVARIETVYQVGRATRLKSDRIKALMDEADRANATSPSTAGTHAPFVALQLTAAPGCGGSLAVELQNSHGERMRVEHAGIAEVGAMVTAFLSRSS
jgi:hypothetical protein